KFSGAVGNIAILLDRFWQHRLVGLAMVGHARHFLHRAFPLLNGIEHESASGSQCWHRDRAGTCLRDPVRSLTVRTVSRDTSPDWWHHYDWRYCVVRAAPAAGGSQTHLNGQLVTRIPTHKAVGLFAVFQTPDAFADLLRRFRFKCGSRNMWCHAHFGMMPIWVLRR